VPLAVRGKGVWYGTVSRCTTVLAHKPEQNPYGTLPGTLSSFCAVTGIETQDPRSRQIYKEEEIIQYI